MAQRAARTFTPAGPVRRLGPLHHLFAVQLDRDGVALHDDVFGEPLVVLGDVLDIGFADVGREPISLPIVWEILKVSPADFVVEPFEISWGQVG